MEGFPKIKGEYKYISIGRIVKNANKKTKRLLKTKIFFDEINRVDNSKVTIKQIKEALEWNKKNHIN